MRRMLDPTKVGGSLPSTITFDEEGNRTVGKNLGVDGKLTLKSLVSESNPDGDITKELGGGGGGGNTLYEYHLYFGSNNLGINMEGKFYTDVNIGGKNKIRTSQQIKEQLLPQGAGFALTLDVFGAVKMTEGGNTTYYPLVKMDFSAAAITLYYLNPTQGITAYSHNFMNDSDNKWNVIRNIASPRNG